MYNIEVDFEVYKQLTMLRETEDVTNNDVIRKLLGLSRETTQSNSASKSQANDWITQGVRFPVGTEFRKNYKGKTYTAKVQDGCLVLGGKQFNSVSMAAVSVTGINTNGWRFWECKLPGSSTWQLIERLRRK